MISCNKLNAILAGSLVTIVVGSCTAQLAHDFYYPLVCTQHQVVDSIVELKYRTAVVRLADGTLMPVYQATLKPGDSICTRMERNPK